MSEGSTGQYRYREPGNPSGDAGERLSRLIVAQIQALQPGKTSEVVEQSVRMRQHDMLRTAMKPYAT